MSDWTAPSCHRFGLGDSSWLFGVARIGASTFTLRTPCVNAVNSSLFPTVTFFSCCSSSSDTVLPPRTLSDHPQPSNPHFFENLKVDNVPRLLNAGVQILR